MSIIVFAKKKQRPGWKRTKEELLAHYAEKEPQTFIQFDGFLVEGQGDDVVCPDEDGHSIWHSVTNELMNGSNVRLFVNPNTPPAEAIAMLKKMIGWIEKDGLQDPEGDAA